MSKTKINKGRNWEVVDMILGCKGGPMRDRRERRVKEAVDFEAEYGYDEKDESKEID